jgi:glycosyltransferase involved in cell wall biosynthesis
MPHRFFGVSGMREALERDLDSFNLVHVHGIWSVPSWLAIDICRKRRVPYVISPRGMLDQGSLGHHRLRKALWYRLWEKGNLRRAAFLHATSTCEAESIQRLHLGPETLVIPNGVDDPPGSRSDFRARWGLPERARLVTFLGRLHPTKRLDLLVEAFRRVQPAIPDSILVLAGRPDGLDPRSLGMGPKMRWVGELDEDEKWGLLAESSVLVMCSDSESFGMSVLEALASGVPVVVTRTCPWEEVATHGCGFWVSQDATSIAEGIQRILSDESVALRMKESARALVARRYRWPAIGQEMAQRYEQVRRLGSVR